MKPSSKQTWMSWTLPLLVGAGYFLALRALPAPFLSAANAGADGGDLLAAVLTGGVPHPSGYPTYLLWAGLIQHLPGDQDIYKAGLASLLPAAAALAWLTAFVSRITAPDGPRRWIAGLGAALVLGAAPLFAGQAVIIEVYSLHTFFLVIGLWTAFLLLDGRWRPWFLPAGAFLYGLGMGVHLTLLVLAPVLAYAWWVGGLRARGWKTAIVLAGAFLAGLSVYLILPLRAAGSPPVNWGTPQTLDGLFWLVSGGSYRGLVFGVQPGEVIQRLGYGARLLVTEFTPAGIALALFGLVEGQLRRWNWMLGWLFLVSFVYAVGYNTNDSFVYLIPAWTAVAVWTGAGIAAVWPRAQAGWPWGKLLTGLLLALVLVRIPVTLREIDPRRTARLAQTLQQVLAEAPADAVLVTGHDLDTFPLWYAHFGRGERPDLRILCAPLLQFDWYLTVLKNSQPDLSIPGGAEGDISGAVQQANPHRPVCSIQVEAGPDPGLRLECPLGKE